MKPDLMISDLHLLRSGRGKVQMSFWALKPPAGCWKEFQIVGTLKIGDANPTSIDIRFECPDGMPGWAFKKLMEYVRWMIKSNVDRQPPTKTIEIRKGNA